MLLNSGFEGYKIEEGESFSIIHQAAAHYVGTGATLDVSLYVVE